MEQIVLVGNPIDGFQTYGPFKSPDEATAWAEKWQRIMGNTWFLSELRFPEDP